MSSTFNIKKLLVPVIIIIVTAIVILTIRDNPPKNKQGNQPKAPQITVETITLTPQAYQVIIQSFGTVQPRTQSVLFAQVSGKINHVSQQFRDGGFFEQGDTLIQLDDRDLRAEVNIAQASLMSANQNLQEEDARVQQAKSDWARLGNGKSPNALVLRQPQYEAAKAQVLSANALLDKAKLSLERTKIIAPYAGRILNKKVDIGQVISSSTQLADIFATDSVEIRLPIKNKDLSLMTLPEEYRNLLNNTDTNTNKASLMNHVIISSTLMGNQTWQGKVVRTESAIDEISQQLYVIAQIINPYDGEYNQGGQIKIGQYVTAKITGKKLENILVIPTSAIYQSSYVYTVEKGLLMRKEIQVDWQNGAEAIVTEGLIAGDELVLTSLGQVNSGTPVDILGQPAIVNAANTVTKTTDNMPEKRRKTLEKVAKEKGITVDALMVERHAKKIEKRNISTVNNL